MTIGEVSKKNKNKDLPASPAASSLASFQILAGFRKDRGTRDQIAKICSIIQKAREFQKKTSTFALLTMPKPLIGCITTDCGKFLKRWEYQTTIHASLEICLQVRSKS